VVNGVVCPHYWGAMGAIEYGIPQVGMLEVVYEVDAIFDIHERGFTTHRDIQPFASIQSIVVNMSREYDPR